MRDCQWKYHPRKNNEIDYFVRLTFSFKRALSFQKLVSNIRSGEILYEFESVKSKVEQKEPSIVGFSILSYSKLHMLEWFYNLCHIFCNFSSFEEMEMHTDSLNLALAHNSLEDCIKGELKEIWNTIQKSDCSNEFSADSTNNFFPRTYCERHIEHNKREPGLFEEEFRCTEMICLSSKTYCCFDKSLDNAKFRSKSLNNGR